MVNSMKPPVESIIASRGIEEVLHFTTNNGFVGCLEMGSVLSRYRLPNEKHLSYIMAPTADREEGKEWFDKTENWLDYVNMSVSEINYRFFSFAQRRHHGSDRWFLILSFSSEILTHENVYFTTTNNIYVPYVKRARHGQGLEAMFAPNIQRKASWYANRARRAERLTTCEQAEVLYPCQLSLDYLMRVYARTEDEADHAAGCLRRYQRSNVAVLLDPSKFDGQPN
ncbi:DarT ssDNA thymidine ADP-ribosyltransferase family protein [Azospirillum sp. SYSU D00513]|uniref:DarT ssDNA thymidine ADP-ribosyltransferase family protein n=1 Tax=Azospirillum sp. SYSU D00513 TaxID=2812561 RepID=UPI001A968528|nr:DarT ssDNA thymidine ADP-ribosyltransferase family protein [Azospirillum sp. SYSU D00513]